ncbi:SNF2 family N-terminal domain-containing protein [Cruoricaptor ignavus]|uniref:SNF2 family N-terminal domain-containing protein n=1 Tax=Cruoricaptor ignavus TaxID=1118202 RepID=A0A1M6HBY3_9FLAO|nr:DEAD/DEAH box helicase [Cruoricaptor ignavus]SHJ19701.1 SNF2 family N-terminal domain-containing protein [Cruoricaptor ignavus]
MDLEALQRRIKGSKIYESKGGNRLYFSYKRNYGQTKYSCWFEIVNDKIKPFVKVYCPAQHPNWEESKANEIVDSIYRQFHEVINKCEKERRKIPLHERLKDDVTPVHEGSMLHQAQALRFCCSMKVSALFADTGTGKSKVAVDLAISRFEAGQINKVLIFCPVSTKKNFREEIDKWAKNTTLEWKIVGLESMSSSDRTVLEVMKFVDNQTQIIIDESHNCKTPTAKRSRRIKEVCDKASYKLIMTGTPAESIKDMFMQYGLLSDLIIGERNWLSFEEKYLICDDRGDIIGYKNVDYLMGLVEPYTYQVRKEDVMDLPGKNFHEFRCGMTPEQSEEYFRLKEELLEKMDKFDKDMPVPAALIFLYFTKMQQASCGFKATDEGITNLNTFKYSLLEKADYRNGQTIIFCKYIYELERLVEFLGPENCAVFTGNNRNNRNEEKEAFTNREKQFFVATMSSGGTGLNGLQHCNRIIFWSNSFKYNERKQCIGRIDRKGQTREMDIYDFRTECGIEHRIANNLARKGNLSEEIKTMLKDKTELKNYIKKHL